MVAFVAATPSLLVFPRLAFFGDRGMLFGARQYGAGGWLGVMPQSNALYYGEIVAGASGGWRCSRRCGLSPVPTSARGSSGCCRSRSSTWRWSSR